MTPPAPETVRILNQRYPRWVDMLGGMCVGLIVFGALGLNFFPRAYDRLMVFSCLVGILGVGAFILYGLFQLWDLRRPESSRPVTARILFDWLVLGIRHKELGPADGWTALVLFRGLPGLRHPVHHVNLGDSFEVDNLWIVARFPAPAMTQVQFAPDPKEDYVGSEHPVHLREAVFQVDMGRQFRLTVTEADAQVVRRWAESKGIAVCDRNGYRPRPLEPGGTA